MTDTTTVDRTTDSTVPDPVDPDAAPPGMVSMRACDLQDLLTALVECTSTTSDYPMLTSIRLEAGNGRLSGMATDQYVLGHATKPAEGTADPIYVSTTAARRMLTELATVDRFDVVTLLLAGERLGLSTRDAFTGFYTVIISDRLSGYPATLADLLTVAGYEQIGLSGLVAIAPHYLGRIAAATKTSGDPVARLYFRAAELPVRVEVGDWLVMLIMPFRIGGRDPLPQTPNNPAGLPANPIDVELTDAEPTEISWPRTPEQATPQRLARHYAAHVQHLQRRVFDERFPDLPKYADQNPVERRMANAMADLNVALVDSYAMSLLIRAFLEAAPAAAASACLDLWEALDAGDSIGEETWGWLKADEVDPEAIVSDDVAAERFARSVEIAQQAFSTLPPVEPFRRGRHADGDDHKPPAEQPAADSPFPTVEVTPAEIAEDLDAIDRDNARARETEEGRGEQPAAGYVPADPWAGLPVAGDAQGDGDQGDGEDRVKHDDDQPDDDNHPGWDTSGTVPAELVETVHLDDQPAATDPAPADSASTDY